MFIEIYPRKGKPYYFQKMIGKYGIKGTGNLKEATMFLTLKEAEEVIELIEVFIKYGLFIADPQGLPTFIKAKGN